MDESNNVETYRVKWIKYKSDKLAILLQSVDGECPFICFVNILLLSKRLTIDESKQKVSFPFICSSITRLLPGEDCEWIYNTLNSLKCGLLFNCTFNDTNAIIDKDPARLFELFNIPVKHGWIADTNSYKLLHGLTYDELQTRLAIYEGNSGENPNISNDEHQLLHIGSTFIESYATQLTDIGIAILKTEIDDGALAAVYRNNHLLVVTRKKCELYALITDLSYLNYDCLWESLESGSYFDDQFRPFRLKPCTVPTKKLTFMQRVKSFFKRN